MPRPSHRRTLSRLAAILSPLQPAEQLALAMSLLLETADRAGIDAADCAVLLDDEWTRATLARVVDRRHSGK